MAKALVQPLALGGIQEPFQVPFKHCAAVHQAFLGLDLVQEGTLFFRCGAECGCMGQEFMQRSRAALLHPKQPEPAQQPGHDPQEGMPTLYLDPAGNPAEKVQLGV
eukprot:2114357-Rhodomonas_salina.1